MLTNRSTGKTTPIPPWDTKGDKSLSDDEQNARYKNVNSDTRDCNSDSVNYRSKESGYDGYSAI